MPKERRSAQRRGDNYMEAERVVAVIEDDEGMRNAVRRLLESAGLATRVFDSAEALLASWLPSSADCLVLDVTLPGLSGLELPRRLAAVGAVPPIVFITARDVPEARRQALAASRHFLVKPFTPEALVDAVTQAMAP